MAVLELSDCPKLISHKNWMTEKILKLGKKGPKIALISIWSFKIDQRNWNFHLQKLSKYVTKLVIGLFKLESLYLHYFGDINGLKTLTCSLYSWCLGETTKEEPPSLSAIVRPSWKKEAWLNFKHCIY